MSVDGGCIRGVLPVPVAVWRASARSSDGARSSAHTSPGRCARRSATCCGPIVAHSEAHYKAKFVAAFRKPVLRCVGTNHGALCPQAFEVDLTTPRTFVALELLHLDHEQDVAITCDSVCV